MKMLVVDDDFTCRTLLSEILKSYGSADIAVNGKEAVEAVKAAMAASEPYELICLDVMMPIMDGQEALAEIRAFEVAQGISSSKGAKIVMTTSLGDAKNTIESYKNLCDAYLVKPIDKAKLLEAIRKLKLIE